MALLDVEKFKGLYHRIVGSLRSEEIASLIASADALMSMYCGYRRNTAGTTSLSSSTYSLKYNGPSTQNTVLPLGAAPIVSVEHLYVDTARAFGMELTEGADFDLDVPGGRINLLPGGSLTRFPVATQAIWCQFTAGYDPTPDDLIPATASVVQALMDRPNLQQQASASLGGVSVSTTDLENFLPAAVRATLDAGYKLVNL